MSSIPKFVYVDCFSYKGIYPEGDCDEPIAEPVYGSPIIGIRALDDLQKISWENDYPVETYTILIEEDKSTYDCLIENLKSLDYGPRLKTSGPLSNLRSNDIFVINKDSTEFLNELISFTDRRDTWSFYLLDPFGPGIPYNFVKPIIQGNNHDVMINLIYFDLARKSGMLFSDKINSQHEQQISRWKNVFEPDIWHDDIYSKLAVQHATNFDLLPKDREEIFFEGYYNTLKITAPDANVKFIKLRFPDRERSMLHLFLTTHDPTGALAMNKVLYDTELLENELRHKISMAGEVRAGQKSFITPDFGLDSTSNKKPRPTKKQIANRIYTQFSGKTTNRREIYRFLVDTDYFDNEVDKALRLLKSDQKCHYDGSNLYHDMKIIFN